MYLDHWIHLKPWDVTEFLKLFKNCALALYQPLHHLFQLSLLQFYLLSEWCTHLLNPIFISGNQNSVKNYRLISLLCVISKVLGRLVNPRRACAARVTVVVLGVCLSVCLYVSTYSRTTGTKPAHERYQRL